VVAEVLTIIYKSILNNKGRTGSVRVVFSEGLAVFRSVEIVLAINVVVGVFGVPVRVTHLVLLKQVLLGAPHVFGTVRVLG